MLFSEQLRALAARLDEMDLYLTALVEYDEAKEVEKALGLPSPIHVGVRWVAYTKRRATLTVGPTLILVPRLRWKKAHP